MSATISSKRYAQAAFQIALDRNELDKWQSDLSKIAELMQNPEFIALAENPVVPFELKANIAKESLKEMNPLALNLSYILISKNKFKNAGQIAREYDRLLDGYYGIKRAEVITAIPLDKSEKENLTRRFEATFGSKVIIEFNVDQSIMGGFIAIIDDSLIDGSIRNKLKTLKINLVGARK